MRALGAALMLVALAAGSAAAQELEPRAYSPSPIGTTFLVVTATRSAGGVFTDPSAPISNVEAEVGLLGLGVGHVFAAAGKQALVLALLPVAWGEASGDVGEERRFASRRGLADPRVKLSMILAGSPAMDRETFARTPRRTVVGTSLTIAMPAGQYDPARLINLGLNRWAFKPEIGISYPARRWTLDAYAGVWFFTENDAYFPGSSIRRQDPIVALQGHVSYTLGRRAWLAVNATWYAGGRTTVDGEDKGDLLRNARLGATWALPIGSRQSFKVSYSAGAATRIGSDFRTIGVAWQILIL